LGRTRRGEKRKRREKKSVWKQQLFSFILVFISNLCFWDWKIHNLIIRSDAHRIDVTLVLLSWKDDHEVAWRKNSQSFLMCYLHIVLEDYGGIMCHKGLYLCVTCHESFYKILVFILFCDGLSKFSKTLSCIFKCVLNLLCCES
jgi:hypothetical protein